MKPESPAAHLRPRAVPYGRPAVQECKKAKKALVHAAHRFDPHRSRPTPTRHARQQLRFDTTVAIDLSRKFPDVESRHALARHADGTIRIKKSLKNVRHAADHY